ncbi:MAG: hypothetical protein ACYTDY_06450 [Planctomycetota bacterium]
MKERAIRSRAHGRMGLDRLRAVGRVADLLDWQRLRTLPPVFRIVFLVLGVGIVAGFLFLLLALVIVMVGGG